MSANDKSPREVLGVIGGSGVYEMDNAEVIQEHSTETPFGFPSDKIVETKIGGKTVFFLPRHGRGHRLLPSEVPYQANIFALKKLGVNRILAVSAVGIMREEISPGDMVIPEQIFDRTKGIRPSTFFGDGIVGHVGFADPFCSSLREVVIKEAGTAGATVHGGGAYICMEGPQFSTRAESEFYRKTLNPSVIGMTAVPEAKLAREAEICYSMLALATDYDCWHETEEDVSVDAVLAVLSANSVLANRIVSRVAEQLSSKKPCRCHEAGKHAILTNPAALPEKTKEKLGPLYGKYWS